jgi:hypothetical protein
MAALFPIGKITPSSTAARSMSRKIAWMMRALLRDRLHSSTLQRLSPWEPDLQSAGPCLAKLAKGSSVIKQNTAELNQTAHQ